MQLAYLDAGSGSLIASVLVGGAAAVGVAAKSARDRVTGMFTRRRRDPGDTGEAIGDPGAPDEADAPGDDEAPASEAGAAGGEGAVSDDAASSG